MQTTRAEAIPWRTQAAVYAAGAFNHSMGQMVIVVMPLWVLTLETSPVLVGVALGARHALGVPFSIHGGALIDRLGTRRVMLGFGLITALVPLLFPVLPWIWAVIVLQMVAGFSQNTGWNGAQAMIGQVMKGNPTHAGRLAFFLRLGHFSGPPLIGAGWDIFGPWGAFLILSLWGSCAFIAAWFLPVPPRDKEAARRPVNAGDLMPRAADYVAAFRLLAVPAVLFIILLTFLRHAGIAIQGSFFIVYLEGIGVSGTAIGTVFSLAAALGAAGTLLAGPLARRFNPVWLALISVAVGIALISLTPLFGAYVVILAAMALRGGAMGFDQPLIISILGRSLDAQSHGKGVGLRATANRLMNTVLPVIMGGVVEVAGLENAFYLIGGVAVGLVGLLALHGRRHQGFRET
jgi:MFS family permease